MKEAHPGAVVEVWAQDEARFGLIPSYRRVWAPRGRRPLASSRRRYQWAYLYGFVHPASGRTEWMIGNTVNVTAINHVLAHFARAVGVGPKKRIVLVWDGAGWHSSRKIIVPDGLHLVSLPPYSPELQPAECVWPLVREVIANREFRDIDHITQDVSRRCIYLAAHPDLVQKRTAFHWWPDHPNLQMR